MTQVLLNVINLFTLRKLKNNKYKYLILIIILIFFLGNCSAHRKTFKKIETPTASPPLKKKASQKIKREEAIPPPKDLQTTLEAVSQDKTPNEINEDSPTLLEEAYDAYQDALLAWQKGDFETALAALDETYSLILKLKLPQDSPLIQEKNDLRLLIAQRIQEIYASRLITVGDNNQTIPLVENKYVKAEIKNFQTKEKEFFVEAFKRSGLYREMILEELKKAGLPEQLSWIPLIESGFKVRAFSRARALGLWQFISSTGYRFGLKRDHWIDERMDFLKSTRAAIQYLKELHSFFGDWTTALAAYNCGEFKVQKTIRNQRLKYLDNFWDLYVMLPRETSRFVPRFISALLIINHPEKYSVNLPQPYPPLKYEIITISRPLKLSTLSKNLGLELKELVSLNPELRYDATPDYEFNLKVPIGYSEKTLAAINSIPRWIPPEATYIFHYVRRGETLSGIARRYRTSVSAVARLNHLRRVHLIRPGQRLKIPARRKYYSFRPAPKLIAEGKKLVYIVRRGDSLYLIANSFNTTVQKIKKENNLKINILHIGQKLIIRSGKPEGAIPYKVKPGDTPFDIAKKFGINLNQLLRLNGLSPRSKIYPGQLLWIPPKH